MAKKIVRLVLLLLGVGVLLGATLLIALRWDSIPAEVPTNFSASGQPESFSPKSALWTMLAFGWGGFVLTAVIGRTPALWRGNGGFIRVSTLRLGGGIVLGPNWLSFDLISLELALLFSYMAVCSARCRSLGAWFLPAFLVVLLLTFAVPGLLMRDAG